MREKLFPGRPFVSSFVEKTKEQKEAQEKAVEALKKEEALTDNKDETDDSAQENSDASKPKKAETVGLPADDSLF